MTVGVDRFITLQDRPFGYCVAFALAQDLLALMGRFNRAGGSAIVIPGDYLETVIIRR